MTTTLVSQPVFFHRPPPPATQDSSQLDSLSLQWLVCIACVCMYTFVLLCYWYRESLLEMLYICILILYLTIDQSDPPTFIAGRISSVRRGCWSNVKLHPVNRVTQGSMIVWIICKLHICSQNRSNFCKKSKCGFGKGSLEDEGQWRQISVIACLQY